MEERYQTAAKQDIQQVLQTSSATLKFLISRDAAAFQGKASCFLFPNVFILFLIFIFDYLKVIY